MKNIEHYLQAFLLSVLEHACQQSVCILEDVEIHHVFEGNLPSIKMSIHDLQSVFVKPGMGDLVKVTQDCQEHVLAILIEILFEFVVDSIVLDYNAEEAKSKIGSWVVCFLARQNVHHVGQQVLDLSIQEFN